MQRIPTSKATGQMQCWATSAIKTAAVAAPPQPVLQPHGPPTPASAPAPAGHQPPAAAALLGWAAAAAVCPPLPAGQSGLTESRRGRGCAPCLPPGAARRPTGLAGRSDRSVRCRPAFLRSTMQQGAVGGSNRSAGHNQPPEREQRKARCRPVLLGQSTAMHALRDPGMACTGASAAPGRHHRNRAARKPHARVHNTGMCACPALPRACSPSP